MRRALATLAVVSVLVSVMAVPALADDPIVFRDQAVFDDINPCSGELMTVTLDLLIEVRESEDVVTVRVRRTGHTSDGYLMNSGFEFFVDADGSIYDSFTDPWINPATGESFVAQGRSLEVDGDVLVDDFRLVCRS